MFSPAVVDNLSFLGSILIFCVGVNLAFGNKFKVANLLPALVVGRYTPPWYEQPDRLLPGPAVFLELTAEN